MPDHKAQYYSLGAVSVFLCPGSRVYVFCEINLQIYLKNSDFCSRLIS